MCLFAAKTFLLVLCSDAAEIYMENMRSFLGGENEGVSEQFDFLIITICMILYKICVPCSLDLTCCTFCFE